MFEMTETIKNGNSVQLYMDKYHIKYCITVFTPDYRVIETKKTSDYFHALNLFTILKNKYNK